MTKKRNASKFSFQQPEGERKAYLEGKLAESSHLCPYFRGSRKWIEWQRGYITRIKQQDNERHEFSLED